MSDKKFKNINIKVDEALLEKINYYRKLDVNGELTQADFVVKALEEKCSKTQNLRSGGMDLKIPNPDRAVITESAKEIVLQALANCSIEFKKVNPAINFGIDEIFAYARYHMYEMSKLQRDKFENNFYEDLKFEEENQR